MNKEKQVSNGKFRIWCWLSLLSFIGAGISFYKGVDKMVNYYNSELSFVKSVNAYVGGDAYNYIINGTYSTAFFVLTAMFVLAGIGFIMLHYLSDLRADVIEHKARECGSVTGDESIIYEDQIPEL